MSDMRSRCDDPGDVGESPLRAVVVLGSMNDTYVGVTLPRRCVNQFTKRPKRKYGSFDDARVEAERLNLIMKSTQYDVYWCSFCTYIHVGRKPLKMRFSQAAHRRETAALANELGPRALHCLWRENETIGEEARIKAIVKSWRRAVPYEEVVYPPRVLP